MIADLKQHPKWEATKKLGYNEFLYSVELGPFTRYGAVRKAPLKHARYRERCLSYETLDKVVSVYSNDVDYINDLISKYPVIKVRTPVDQQHASALSDFNTKFEFRKKLWYGKYRYRLVVFRSFRNLRNMWSSWAGGLQSPSPVSDKTKECRNMIYQTFDSTDSRIQKSNEYMYTYFSRDQLPIIYTNDDGALMMFKLMCDDSFEIEITTVFIVE